MTPPERTTPPSGRDGGRPKTRRSSRAAPGPNEQTLRGVRSLRVHGKGRIVMHLSGTGRVNLRRGRFDDFCFEGRGLPKHLSAEQVHLDAVEGVLTLEGTELCVEFSGGRADIHLTGRFEVVQRAA